MSAAAVLIGYVLIEFPISEGFSFFARNPLFALANFAVLALVYAAIYLIGQRTRGAIAVFLAACFVIGIANHYVISFKGQPIVPADLLALSTAFNVAGSYSFVPDATVIISALIFIASCVALRFCPKALRTRRSTATGTAGGLAAVCVFALFMGTCSIDRDLGCTVSSWNPVSSYRDNGAALCFLERVQSLLPVVPDGYSDEAAAALLAPYVEAIQGDDEITTTAVYTLEGSETSTASDESAEESVRPNVVVIMNETFSDLSYLPGLDGTAAYPAVARSLSEEAVFSGNAYASILGAGTCNSEFEFLATATMAALGDGVYPYSMYDLSDAETLVSYFNDLGYSTSAIHPAEATNWRRDIVYADFGFERFDDISTFTDPETLRDYPTDAETYQRVIEMLTESDDPQFIFNVTIQNHGGYSTGLISDEDAVSVTLEDGSENAQLNEYLSSLQRADTDLAAFIEALRELDEPVIVCFFGDHQPNYSEWPFENPDLNAGDSLAEVQERYSVPYFIWANYNTGLPTGTVVDTSLNYLASLMIEVAGLPETPLLSFVSELREAMPAINANGYLDTEGTWHVLSDAERDAGGDGAAGRAADALHNYAIVQYANLFRRL